jgi:hypothetical protein
MASSHRSWPTRRKELRLSREANGDAKLRRPDAAHAVGAAPPARQLSKGGPATGKNTPVGLPPATRHLSTFGASVTQTRFPAGVYHCPPV